MADFQALFGRLDAAARALEEDTAVDSELGQKVLLTRAAAIAGARETIRKEGIHVLAFRVGGERYAVLLERVDHVIETKQLSSLPGVPRHILGAMVSRSRVILVVDLRPLLGLEGGGMSDLTKIVIVEEGTVRFGIAVEEVTGREELPVTEENIVTDQMPFLRVTPERLAVLSLPALVDRMKVGTVEH